VTRPGGADTAAEPAPSRRPRWTRFISGRSASATQSEQRYIRVSQATITAVVGRVTSVLATLVTIPLTVHYLGPERYGAWVTLSTILAWAQLADLGLVNGLTNAIAEAHARDDRALAQRYVATAFWALTMVSVVLAAIYGAAYAHVNWPGMLGTTSTVAARELPVAVSLSVALFLLSLPLTVVERIYIAHQEGAIANAWSIAGNVLTLVSVVLVTRSHGGLPALVTAVAGVRLLALLGSASWLAAVRRPYLVPRPSCFDRVVWRRLGADGAQLFVIQLAAMLLLSTDNYIIARILGASYVTPYSIAWSLFTIPQMLASVSFPYLWAAYGDAVARRDVAWITRAFRRALLVSIGFSALVAAPLALVGGAVIRFWVGAVAVPPTTVLVWMAVWSVTFAFMNGLSCFLNANGRFRGQTLYGTATALLNIALSVWWAGKFGLSGVIAATVVSYLSVAVVPASLEALSVLRRLRNVPA